MENKIIQFKKTINWIYKHSIGGQGIAVTSKQKKVYPEVTGYYIPSLIEWGYKDLAFSYAKYLCSLQKPNGAWYDPNNTHPYIFDTAQILKGLIACYKFLPNVKNNIIKGCDWLLSNVAETGRLKPAFEGCFPKEDFFYSELIHTYCLTPLMDSAELFDIPEYKKAAIKIKDYYINNYKEKILNFSLLSHFYAYVMEGLVDIGETELVKKAMKNIEQYQSNTGYIPGLNNVQWTCSTGLFQLAIVYYKLEELDKGNALFDYACKLQNTSGGWYGSYPTSFFNKYFVTGIQKAHYFQDEEISWANKYFLDALAWKQKLEFEKAAPIFIDKIDKTDGRYIAIKKILVEIQQIHSNKKLSICDIGCGKGRYLNNLLEDYPKNNYFAVDLSETVMANINSDVSKKNGRLTNIPHQDNEFDFTYVCEALEHSVNITGALNELFRITKKDGIFFVIDKPSEKLGVLQIDAWEQWIDDSDMKEFADKHGCKLEIINDIEYENKKIDGLFRGWIFRK